MNTAITKLAAVALAASIFPRAIGATHTGGAEVAVVYNSNMGPDSRLIAEYYAEKRHVPKSQIIGLPMPRSETITRAEFRAQIQEPLLQQLESLGLLSFRATIIPASAERPGMVLWVPVDARVRYLVLTYGVPLRVSHDESAVPPAATNLPPQQRRTEASVDSELALLPIAKRPLRLHGPYRNPLFGTTNASALSPTNGIFMVGRIDGPGPRVARELVDKAIEAESNGLWGYAYFDLRGLGNSPYRKGDDWLRAAAEVAKTHGFAPIVDDKPATFPTWFPMPHIAIYAGWYDNAPSGPFTRPTIEFMPGAFAYHLFSYSATTLRTPSTWAASLLDKGVTATVGYVFEPYLDATIDVSVFMSRWMADGWTLGEAATAAQPVFSWQTTVVGDPLYRPFARTAEQWQQELAARNSPLVPWADLRLLNRDEAAGTPRRELIDRLSKNAALHKSPMLELRLAELCAEEGRESASVQAMERALKLKPSPQLRAQLQLGLARRLASLNRHSDSLRYYEQLTASETDKHARIALIEEALPVARKAGATPAANRFEAEIANLRQALTNQSGANR